MNELLQNPQLNIPVVNVGFCLECNTSFKTNREECMDMCDDCYVDFLLRIEKMKNPDYMMDVMRSAVRFSNDTGKREIADRAFFACLFPNLKNSQVAKILASQKKTQYVRV